MASKGFKAARNTKSVESVSDRIAYARASTKSTQSKRPHAGDVNEEGEGRHGPELPGGRVYGANSKQLAAAARFHSIASQQDHHSPASRPTRFRAAGDVGNTLPRKEHDSQ